MSSLYKFSNGTYVDLDKILAVEPPFDNVQYGFQVSFFIHAQLQAKPIEVWWDVDFKILTEENIMSYVELQHKQLLTAWAKNKRRWWEING